VSIQSGVETALIANSGFADFSGWYGADSGAAANTLPGWSIATDAGNTVAQMVSGSAIEGIASAKASVADGDRLIVRFKARALNVTGSGSWQAFLYWHDSASYGANSVLRGDATIQTFISSGLYADPWITIDVEVDAPPGMKWVSLAIIGS